MELIPFSNWDITQELKDKLAAMGITVPTPVQQQCLQPILDGQDLLVQSRTGTGKTIAFALPVLGRLSPGRGPVEVLIVLPTRELAMQVSRALNELGADTALLYGGGGYGEQFAKLRSGAHIVVGTPGRLCDHLERGSLKLEDCHTLILDEADEILDMGFAEELDKVLQNLPSQRQTLLFSATMPPQMEALAGKTLHNPHRIAVSTGLAAAIEIRHRFYAVAREYRQDALVNVLYVEKPDLAIIFCHTRAETEEVTEYLQQQGFAAGALHGEMAQNERTRTLNNFRRRQINLLVATDVAARGLDIRGITHVFNLSVPRTSETYIHRVGRTGRAGDDGLAITFVSPRDTQRFRRSLSEAHINIEQAELPQGAEVRRRLRDNFHSLMCTGLANGVDPGFYELANEVLAYIQPAEALALLLSKTKEATAVFTAGLEVPVPKMPTLKVRGNKLLQQAQSRAAVSEKSGKGCIQINLGRSDDLQVTGLLKLIKEVTGLTNKQIGDIDIRAHSSFFELPLEITEETATALEGFTVGKTVIKARPVHPSTNGEKSSSSNRSGETRSRDFKGSHQRRSHGRCSNSPRNFEKGRSHGSFAKGGSRRDSFAAGGGKGGSSKPRTRGPREGSRR